MKKSVSIITLYYNNNNYGAMLQAYALSFMIKELNFICDVLKIEIKYEPTKIKNYLKRYGAGRLIKKVFFVLIKKMKMVLLTVIIKKEFNSRMEKFIKFRDTKIPHSDKIYNLNNIQEILDKYEIYITGSDQVWNHDNGYLNPIYWLEFVPSTNVKISYAASIGVNNFTPEQIQQARQYLSNFTAISVREKEAKELLDGLLDGSKDVHWVFDPTLLLTREKWDGLCTERRIKEKYVFAYILGGSVTQRKFIQKFAKTKGCRIVTLPYILSQFRFCDLNFGDIKLYDVSPEDFISLIKYAEYVFTDSFHGMSFSGIYHKEFFVFKRNKDSDKSSMNSRIYSLMELFGIDDRVIDEQSDISIIDGIRSINYVKVDRNIEEKRKYSLNFLENALRAHT